MLEDVSHDHGCYCILEGFLNLHQAKKATKTAQVTGIGRACFNKILAKINATLQKVAETRSCVGAIKLKVADWQGNSLKLPSFYLNSRNIVGVDSNLLHI